MKNKKRWYQIVRAILPLLYSTAIALAIIWKSFFIMILLMATALLTGAFYCGWLCPFGFFQEWMGKLGRVLKLPLLRIPEKVEKWLRFLRYILLGLSVTGLGAVYFITDSYNTFMGGLMGNVKYITIPAWILLGFFIVLSLMVDRPFCRYFCTEGAQYGILSLGRLFTIRRNTTSCISCGACDRRCPVQIKVSTKKHVRNGQCINCFECISACPVPKTLNFGWAFNKQGDKDEQK